MATVVFLDASGNSGADPIFIDGTSNGTRQPGDVAACAKLVAQTWLKYTRVVPPQCAVAVCRHESFYKLNEQDTEANGHVTVGPFMTDSDDRYLRAHMPDKDPTTLEGACAIFAAVCELYTSRIISATNKYNSANNLPTIDASNPPADVWSYVAIAHNQGWGAALATIQQYGLDWNAYKSRNPSVAVVAASDNGVYGDDMQSGGDDWDPSYANPFDDAGNPIPAPTWSALTSANVRLAGALVVLLLLLVLVSQPRWLKVSV